MAVVFSICICNYNMSEHIKESLTSVLTQLNDDFEVVVIDDGSSDESVRLLQDLTLKFSNLRVFPYPRDSRRFLGFTRNLSIKHALGEYVVLHIDADDIWDYGIVDWCEKARQLSQRMDDNVYIAGKQINMVNKKMLTDFGGYRNIFYTEDRDLWMRLAAHKKILFVYHELFRTRMKLSSGVKYRKLLKVMWHILLNDLRTGSSVQAQLMPVLKDSCQSTRTRGFKNAAFRVMIFPIAAVIALLKGPIHDFRPALSPSEWKNYKIRNTKNFSEWFAKSEIE